MPDFKLPEELVARFSALLTAAPAQEIEKNLRALLNASLARLDLVTREEFEIQRELLARARDKLSHLEARVAELEARSGRASGA